MKGLFVAGVLLMSLVGASRAQTANLSAALPTKAPPPVVQASYDWSGYYLGGNIDYGLADEGARHAGIRHGGADSVGFATRKPRNALRPAETEALVDFRVDPQFGTGPQPHAEIGRAVPRLAALVRNKAIGPGIRRVERGRVLLEKRSLRVDREIVSDQGRRLYARVGSLRLIAVEAIVEAEAHFVQHQIGVENLRTGRKYDAAATIIDEQIFELRGPVHRQGNFYSATGRAAGAGPQERILRHAGYSGAADRHAYNLKAGKLVIAPSEAACRVEQPVACVAEIWRIAETATHGAGKLDPVQVIRGADLRGRSRPVTAKKARKRNVGFEPNEPARRGHVIVAGLQSERVAAVAGGDVVGVGEIQ